MLIEGAATAQSTKVSCVIIGTNSGGRGRVRSFAKMPGISPIFVTKRSFHDVSN